METRQLQPQPQRQRSATTVRYLAPDVARGMALLGIILANIPTAWLPHFGVEHAEQFGGYSGAPTLAEQLLIVFKPCSCMPAGCRCSPRCWVWASA
ncbi:hypothetical protein JKI95_01880 [Corynebacterium aquatimens]|uniref:hypothetical protein n=1 Tax=Corynebacterium aquatimens TaxID=1190508 RepID=UPI0025402BD2|nr:hypothetical protein [Corynebacterium aquatimens]QYH19881.1 hypothetical protein JKI95_01880 [Corynebacterium aquatimens]